MDVLLDTHALIWFLNGDYQELSAKARSVIEDDQNTAFVSVATLWEMAIKIRLGLLTFKPGYESLLALIENNGFDILPITFLHTRELLTLDMIHRDPFDRVLITQSLVEGLTLITKDENIHRYPVQWLW